MKQKLFITFLAAMLTLCSWANGVETSGRIGDADAAGTNYMEVSGSDDDVITADIGHFTYDLMPTGEAVITGWSEEGWALTEHVGERVPETVSYGGVTYTVKELNAPSKRSYPKFWGIPGTVKKINFYSSDIRGINYMGTEPPELARNYSNAVVFVPDEAFEAHKAAWGKKVGTMLAVSSFIVFDYISYNDETNVASLNVQTYAPFLTLAGGNIHRIAREIGLQLDELTIPGTTTQYGKEYNVFVNSFRSIPVRTLRFGEGVTGINFLPADKKEPFPNGENYDESTLKSYSSLEEVYLPSTCRNINQLTFFQCYSLKNVHMLEGLDSIGEQAFQDCISLESLHLPASLRHFGGLQAWLRSCKEVTIPEENPYYTVKDGVIFNKEMSTLVCYPAALEHETYCIPDGVKTVSWYAFEGATGLKSLTVPASVDSLGRDFLRYTALREIHMKRSVPPLTVMQNGFGAYLDVFSAKGTWLYPDYDMYGECTLYVPAGSKDAYASYAPWSQFANIVEEAGDTITASIGHFTYDLMPTGEAVITGWSDEARALTEHICERVPETVSYEGVTYTVTELKATYKKYFPQFWGIPGTVKKIDLRNPSGIRCINYMGTEPPELASNYRNAFVFVPDEGFEAHKAAWGEKVDTMLPVSSFIVFDYISFDDETNVASLNVQTYAPFLTLGRSIHRIAREIGLQLDELTIPGTTTHDGKEYNVFVNSFRRTPVRTLRFGEGVTGIFAISDDFREPYLDGQNYDESTLKSYSSLEEVYLPSTCRNIYPRTFQRCHSLKNVHMQEGLESIGEEAFLHCISLESLHLPASLRNFGESQGWLRSCKDVTIPEENPYYTVKDGVIFDKEMTTLVCYPAGLEHETYRVPDGVKTVSWYAFEGATGLKSLTVPASVDSLGRDFLYYTALREIHMKRSVPPLTVMLHGFGAYQDVFSAKGTWLYPDYDMYGECTLYVPEGSKEAYASIAPWSQFANIVEEAVTLTDVGNGRYTDGTLYYLLDQETNSATVTFTGTGEDEFNVNPSETAYTGNIEIPAEVQYEGTTYTVTSIGSSAFYKCTGLTSITIPESVTSIGSDAFYWCQIRSVNIKDLAAWCKINFNYSNPLNKDAHLYLNGEEVTHLEIPSSVTSIRESAFCGYTGLRSVSFPNSVTSIGEQAFCDCDSLTSVTISESVTSIDYLAFYSCSSLTSITIPESVTSIKHQAFGECESLTDIYALRTDPTAYNCNKNAFQYSPIEKATLHVPFGCKEAYAATYPWSEFGNIVEFEDIQPLEENEVVDFSEEGGLSEETDLDGSVIGNVFYNISSANGSYSDGCIVVTKPTNDEDVEIPEGSDIFGEDFRNNFTGIVFKVPAGSGTVKITAETTGNTTLKVRIGNNPPIEMELSGKLKASFPYTVSVDSYVYIYAGKTAESTRLLSTETSQNMLKIYSVEWNGNPVPTSISNIESNNGSAVYDLQGRRVTQPRKGGIYVVNGKKVMM